MISLILEPLNYEFMRQAIAVGLLVGILCPVVGSYLVVQRMALLGDVMAHCVLPGLSLSFFLGIDLLIGAFASGFFGACLITWIHSQTRIKVDSAMAVIFSSFFALGIILISVLNNKIDLDSLLFGDILGVTFQDIQRTLIITIIILLAIRLFYKEILFYTFDKTGAQAIGLPVNIIYLGLIAALSLTIIASMQAVGVILVISLLIGPALTAYLLVKELQQMMLLGAVIGAFCTTTGVYLSYYWNLPSGPAIVMVSTVLFMLAIFCSRFWRLVFDHFDRRSGVKR